MVQDFFQQEYVYIPLKLTAKHLKIRGFVNGEPSLPFENPTFFVPVAATFLLFREVLLQPLCFLWKRLKLYEMILVVAQRFLTFHPREMIRFDYPRYPKSPYLTGESFKNPWILGIHW